MLKNPKGMKINDGVNGVRLRLWIVVTKRPIVHLPGDMSAWITMVEWYQPKKTPDSSTTALWKEPAKTTGGQRRSRGGPQAALEENLLQELHETLNE
jgi:hypothetical protein